jgi:hypothetical protein
MKQWIGTKAWANNQFQANLLLETIDDEDAVLVVVFVVNSLCCQWSLKKWRR